MSKSFLMVLFAVALIIGVMSKSVAGTILGMILSLFFYFRENKS